MKITEEVEVETTLYRSKTDGRLVLEVDTSLEEDEAIRIFLNDGPIYEGAPAHNESAVETVRKIATLIMPKLWEKAGGRDGSPAVLELLNGLDDLINDHEPEGGWK